MIPFLKMYEQYCSNHHASIKALIELKKRKGNSSFVNNIIVARLLITTLVCYRLFKKDVQKFLAAGEAAVKQSIDSLLITPGNKAG